jgi:hypothetical protein
LILGVLIFVMATGVGAVSWTLSGLPPPEVLLPYGPSSACERTGPTVKADGVKLVEIWLELSRAGPPSSREAVFS